MWRMSELVVQNGFFRGTGLQILFFPNDQRGGLLDMLLTQDPNFFHQISSTFKDPTVVFLLDVLDDESWDKLPNFVKKRILVGMVVPSFDSF